MEELIEEMYQCDRPVVSDVERIQDISTDTQGWQKRLRIL